MESEIQKQLGAKRLNSRQASKASAYLNLKPNGTKIATSLCFQSTPFQVARHFLGTKATQAAVDNLALEIATEVGMIEKAPA